MLKLKGTLHMTISLMLISTSCQLMVPQVPTMGFVFCITITWGNSCFEVKFDPSDLEKKDIVVNGMPFTKTPRHSDDGGSYIRYTGDEYRHGKGYIDKLDEKSIGHFRMGVGDNEYTDFELYKCKDSFIFKQLEYNGK